MDPRDIVALIMVAACILIFGFFGFFLPDWIGISPRKTGKKKAEKKKDETDTKGDS